MAIPPELRCHVYNYLPVRVYKRVFPASEMCYWPVYRMPAALLQLNKTVCEELVDYFIPKPRQRMNDQHSPELAFGPSFAENATPAIITLSEPFTRPQNDAVRYQLSPSVPTMKSKLPALPSQHGTTRRCCRSKTVVETRILPTPREGVLLILCTGVWHRP
jgi:hypothetical protein